MFILFYFSLGLRLLSDLAGGLILSFDKHLDFHAITILLFAGVFISFVKEVIQSFNFFFFFFFFSASIFLVLFYVTL